MYCSAHGRSGKPCKGQAIAGTNVCRMHGGSAPQVRRAAALRLAALVDPAIGVLAHSLKSKTERVKLDAAKDVLDRNGMKDAVKIYVSGPDEGPVRVQFDPENLTDEQLALAVQFARTIPADKPEPGSGDGGDPSGTD